MDFKPAVPLTPAQAAVENPPAPPPATVGTTIVGLPSKSHAPHVINQVVPSSVPVKKEYMWKLRRARGEKF